MTRASEAEAARTGRILVQHAGRDAAWALWLTRQALQAGHRATSARVGEAGNDLRSLLSGPAGPGDTIVLVLSQALVEAQHRDREQQTDWAALIESAEAQGVRLLPVVFGVGRAPAALRGLRAVDLRALEESDAAARFVAALGTAAEAPRFDGTVPLGDAWELPPVRYPAQVPRHISGTVPEPQREWFYGREDELDAARTELETSGRVVVYGVSSVGKSWLAAEYVHRFGSQYNLVAWIRAGQGAMIRDGIGRLGEALGVPADARDPYRAAIEALRATNERYLLVFDGALPDDNPQILAQQGIAGEKPALFAELLPPAGRGHVLFTSVSADWDTVGRVQLRSFSHRDGASFLEDHVRGLSNTTATDFSEFVDGSPYALNVIGHVLAEGTVTAAEYLAQVHSDLADALSANPPSDYRSAHTAFASAMRLLLESDEPNARAAVQLLRLLTAFAPEPIPLTLLNSQAEGTRQEPGARLPLELADALGSVARRRSVLGYVTQFSLASVATDHTSDTGPVLTMHRVPHEILRTQMKQKVALDTQHAAHRLLCDADPDAPGDQAWERRYLQLWRNVLPARVFECDGVQHENDPCSRLPATVRNIAHALRQKGELTACVDLVAAALEAWTPLFGEESIVITRLRIAQFNSLLQLERIEEADESARRVLELLEPRKAEYPSEYMQAADGLSACMRIQGDWIGSITREEPAHQWIEDTFGPDHIFTLRSGHNLAVALRMVGRFEEALDLDTDCYAGMVAHPEVGARHWRALHLLNNVARDRREIGEYGPAARLEEQVVEQMREVLVDPLQQHLLRGRKNLAVSLRRAGEYAGALALSRAFVGDFITVYGEEHFETCAARTSYASDLRMVGELAEAERQDRLAYEACLRINPTHPFTGCCAVNLAATLRLSGRFEEAQRLDEQAAEVFAERLGEEHYYTLSARNGLATDLAEQGELSSAIELRERILDGFRQSRGVDHPYTLQCQMSLSIDLRAAASAAAAADGAADAGADVDPTDGVAKADALESDALDRYRAALGPEHPDYLAATRRERVDTDLEPTPM